MQTNKKHQFQDTEYYVSREAQESGFLKSSKEISFVGRRGEQGDGREGRVCQGKGEGQFPMRTVKLFHNAFQSIGWILLYVCICDAYPYKGDIYLPLIMLGKERSLSWLLA